MADKINTSEQYDITVNACKGIFIRKYADYGMSCRALRKCSIIDQIFIKACRIRTLQESGHNNVGDSIWSEFCGIVNYCVISLLIREKSLKEILTENKVTMQIKSFDSDGNNGIAESKKNIIIDVSWGVDGISLVYDDVVKDAKKVMLAKNEDYGEIWRNLTVESMTDFILTKLLRVKEIQRNGGKTMISEGIDSNLIDIMNYAIFCIILIEDTAE